MRSWLAGILLLMVSAPLLAQTAATPKTSTTTTTTTTTTTAAQPKAKKATTAKKPMAAKPTTATEIKTLRDAVSAQQQQIQMLRDELARRDAAVQQVQQQVNALQSAAQQAQSTAQAAQSSSKQNEDALAALKTNVASVQTTATATATSLQAAEKKVTVLESPLALKYKGITITPGGFLSAQGIWRNHNQNTDNQGVFGAIPFQGSSNYNLGEFRLSTRYTRLSLLAQGKTKTFDVQAYYEIDFQGAAQTANETLTNSFQPRIRELWANVDAPHGLSFVGGQTWSLITPHRTGIGPRGLLLPTMIDGSLVVGYHYARETTLRVSKRWDLANKRKVYLAFAIENPETTSAGATPAGLTIFGLQGGAAVSLGGGTNPTATTPNGSFATNVSIDAAPDFAAKIAIEPGWGHFEFAAIGRVFRDRVAVTATTGTSSAGTNQTTLGGALSFNGLLPVVPKKVDIWFSTLGGRGIGRFGPALGPDVTIRPDGRLMPILAYEGIVGVETHPTPKLDIVLYAGSEYWQRSPYYTGGTALLPTGVGYGLVSADLRGCTTEIPATGTACAAVNKNVYEITPGFWYRFYRGPAGTVQYGMFYEHIHRTTWAGRLDATGAVRGSLNVNQDLIMTAFRWYFP